MADAITGLWAAAATPISTDGTIDHAAFARHLRWMLDHGCDGAVLFGTTGEGPSFAVAERLEATEAVLRAGIPVARLGLGTGCAALPDTVALTKGMLALGIHHALMLPPFFFAAVTPEGIENSYAQVIDRVADARLRICLYHIPQVCGVGVPAVAAARLRERYGAILAGVKDSSGDFAQFLAFRAAAPDIASLVGAEVLIARALANGGKGTICGMANLVPALVRRQFDGSDALADMHCAVAPIDSLPPLKAALAELTGDPVWRNVRPPLCAADTATGARISATLAALTPRQAA
jgi:4-hydroxy-tetrahydrodipicolinate synthase